MREDVRKKFENFVHIQNLFDKKEYAKARVKLLELKSTIPENLKEFYDKVLKTLEDKLAEKTKPPSP